MKSGGEEEEDMMVMGEEEGGGRGDWKKREMEVQKNKKETKEEND